MPTTPVSAMARRLWVLGCVFALAAGLPVTAAAAPAPPPATVTSVPGTELAAGWRTSTDRVVTTDGDATGLHVLAADRRTGYTWRTVASLGVPGSDVDQWIGNSCVTTSGRRAVVVYAPRQAANSEDGFHSGGVAAIIDLDTGAVTTLADGVSLAYYNPGCGVGEQAVLTQNLMRGNLYVSRLITVDATTATVTARVDVAGQITSAIPTASGVVAAQGDSLVAIGGSGRPVVLADQDAVPFRLGIDRDGAINYEVQTGDTVGLHRFAGTVDHVVGSAPARSVRLHTVAGTTYLTGPQATQVKVPSTWRTVAAAVDAEPSTDGLAVVTSATSGTEEAGDVHMTGASLDAQPIGVGLTVLDSGKRYAFTVQPGAATPAAVPPGNDTTDPDRVCAIPRNDPKIQSLQPTTQMAEWAADLAVQGALTESRPAGWNGSNLPAYTPQGLFPSHPLVGGGQVPAQIMLGVLAQESNMWQASPHVTDGESGNFEQGGFYGSGGVVFDNVDCGYGAAQVTTGMRKGETVYTQTQQIALTVDYAANVAAGLQVLQDKWNQLKQLGIVVNNGDPQYLENWWYALWAYNSGYHKLNDRTDPFSKSDAYGLGWSNNVANEDLAPDRGGFLDGTTTCLPKYQDPNGRCNDAKHPADWSYPERIIGFARHSLVRYDYVNGNYHDSFTTATWSQAPQLPPVGTFCQPAANQCDMTKIHKPGNFPSDHGSHCQRDDLACYWHTSATWQPNPATLGTQVLRYLPGAPEPAATHFYNPVCATAPLPSNALIVDDVPADVRTQNGCAKSWTNRGSLTFTFPADSTNHYPAKIDFHQLDTGFGGHFWFSHVWPAGEVTHRVTGTWTLNQQLNSWARVLVYVPDHGAETPQAAYTVGGTDSNTPPMRTVVEGNYLDAQRKPQPGSWHSLGAFHFTGTPSVTLSNIIPKSTGIEPGAMDIAWDAVAFQPLPGKPANQIVVLGDSYTGGEGAGDYDRASNHIASDGGVFDACHRSSHAWSRQASLPDSGSTIGARADALDPSLDYHITACSHSTTVGVGDTTGTGENNEGAQFDQGYLDANTTLVTLTIGGNDARFSELIEFCAKNSCPDAVMGSDPQDLAHYEPQLIRGYVVQQVSSVLTEIHNRAPNAKIVLMGYPVLMVSGEAPHETCTSIYGAKAIAWFADMAHEIDRDYEAMVASLRQQGQPVTYLSSLAAFQGKAACGPAPQINGLTLDRTHAEIPPFPLSQQSFHPMVEGAATYAGLLTDALKKGLP
ncbi:SGNH/GDSL hydrolase family protein [Actinocrispum wychmicini]|nr:SGNH/GDSL hydrolase family protein [Actinocrispum wychmicini]